MNKIQELRAKIAELLEEQKAILDLADSEERSVTEDEEIRFNEIDTEIETLETDVKKLEIEEERRKKLNERLQQSRRITNQPPHMAATYRADNPKEFKNFGEFIYSIRYNPMDSRLWDAYDETRGQSMGVGAEGGFMVPNQFRDDLLSVTPQTAIIRPRAQVIPAGDPPDAAVSIPALDQTAAENIYGGVVVEWIAEGKTKPETDIRLREIELKPNEVAGYITVTDKLLRNWGAASALLQNQLRAAIIGAEETVFYNGDGVGKPLGFLSAPCAIDYSRATASQIAFADVIGMFARILMRGGNFVWIASQTTIPQLAVIQDAAGNYIYVQSATVDVPSSLLGYPVFFHERSVGLGTRGDLVLVNLNYYLIKDGSGPFVQASEHFKFTENKTVIKAFWNVDGQAWMEEPLPLEGDTSNTVSPIIILN